MSYATYMELLTWDYFIRRDQIYSYLGMQIQDIFLIHIKIDHKQDIYSLVATLLYHGDLSKKHYQLPPQIIQKLLQSMEQVVNTFG